MITNHLLVDKAGAVLPICKTNTYDTIKLSVLPSYLTILSFKSITDGLLKADPKNRPISSSSMRSTYLYLNHYGHSGVVSQANSRKYFKTH